MKKPTTATKIFFALSVIQLVVLVFIIDTMLIKRTYSVQGHLKTDDPTLCTELATLYNAETATVHKLSITELEAAFIKHGLMLKKSFIVVFCFDKQPCLTMPLYSKDFRGHFQMTKKQSWKFKRLKVARL